MINSTIIGNSKIFEKNFQVFISRVSLSTTATTEVLLELFTSNRIGYRFMPYWIAYYVISKTGSANYNHYFGANTTDIGGTSYQQWVNTGTVTATGTFTLPSIRGDTTTGKLALTNGVKFYLRIVPSSTAASAATIRTFVRGYWIPE